MVKSYQTGSPSTTRSRPTGSHKAGFPLTRFSMGAVSRAPFLYPAVRPKTASMESQRKGLFRLDAPAPI